MLVSALALHIAHCATALWEETKISNSIKSNFLIASTKITHLEERIEIATNFNTSFPKIYSTELS